MTALALAESMRSEIASCSDEIEQLRRLPDALEANLKSSGAFRLLIPEEFGGKGVALPDFVSALQVFAEADASTAWCISQGAVIATTSLWLQPETLRS